MTSVCTNHRPRFKPPTGLGLGFMLLLCLTWSLSAGAASAEAGNFDEFGFGARASALGGAYTAFASGPEASYYNPGGLILSRHFNVLAGFSFADYQLELDSQAGLSDDRAERIDDLSAYSLGISTTVPFLGEPDRFGLGLAFFLPTRRVVTVSSRAPTSQPEFAQYGVRQDRLQAHLATAVKVTDWLFAGAGLQIFADADGRADVDTLGGIGASEFELDLAGDVAPVVGLYIWPVENLSFGLTYRGEISLKLDFNVTAFGAIPAVRLEAITLFSPDQFALGMAYNPTDDLFLLFDITYFVWSSLEDPFLTNNGNIEKLEFEDTIIPRFGVEYHIDDLALRAGYFFRPSPVPEQDGSRNLIDSSKHVFTFGAGYSFYADDIFTAKKQGDHSDELRVSDTKGEKAREEQVKTSINAFMQIHWHPSQSVDKNVPPAVNDPVGAEFESGGTIINFGLEVVARF